MGDYCVFANDTVEITSVGALDFIYVREISPIDGIQYVYSRDLYSPVQLIYCWKLKMSVHD